MLQAPKISAKLVGGADYLSWNTLLIECPLQHLMKKSSSALEVWKQLQNALSMQGPMYQISLMKKALVTHFNPAMDLDQMILELNYTMDTMFGASTIKEDD